MQNGIVVEGTMVCIRRGPKRDDCANLGLNEPTADR
jgi:hypothetical protein